MPCAYEKVNIVSQIMALHCGREIVTPENITFSIIFSLKYADFIKKMLNMG